VGQELNINMAILLISTTNVQKGKDMSQAEGEKCGNPRKVRGLKAMYLAILSTSDLSHQSTFWNLQEK
jgi:hypothetical protein